jgi:hypothetical protein
MILPEGHARRTQQLRVLAPREKRMIRGVLGTVAILVIVLIISVATLGKKSAHGCISVSLPYSTGGAQIYRCGVGARSLCGGVNKPGLTGPAGQIVARACRKAGIAVG